MASTSPSPNSPPSAVPPASSNSPPPLPSPPRSTPPEPSNAPTPQLNYPPPTITPPLQSLPPTNVAPPPPALTPPPVASSPPTTSPRPQPTPSPPPANTAPTSSSHPPPANTPPTSSSPPPSSIPPSSPPPPLPKPPASSPPPPLSNPPPSSPPPPLSNPSPSSLPPPPNPPSSSPPPPSNPPAISPPSSSTNPPLNSPPPLSSIPSASPPAPPKNDPPPGPRPPTKSPESSPPPPSSLPPVNSPPPPSSKPPESSPPQQAAKPPRKSPPPPVPISPESLPPQSALVSPPKSPPTFLTPPSRSPPASPPSSNSPQRSQPPPIVLRSPPSPPSVVSSPTNNNNSGTNAPESSQSRGTGGTIAIVSVLVFLLLAIFASVGWCIWKRKKKASGLAGGYIMPTSLASSPKSDSTLLKVQIPACINGNGSGRGFENSPREPGALGHSTSWFTYEELAEATNVFSGQNLLGEGGFGSVYKGCIADGRVVAVKQLKIDGGQGEREFRSEVEIISRIHHRHLVSLVGYCISENRRLLVYDYVPNNNLYFHLHGEGGPVMNWATRVRIAVGVARGIAYIHEDCHPRIIHRDIKSSNILLDNNFEARVSDFGLAKLAMDTSTHLTTRVMGTFGYMAPEYATSGKLTEKSDVFSYGVVLLELITGRKPVDTSQPVGEESLVEWARPLLSHALEEEEFEGLADSRLEGNFVGSEMFQMIEAAAICVRHSAAKRPKMGQVVRMFDSMATPDLTNGMKVGESAIFNSAQQSAEIRLFRRMAFGGQNYSTDFFSQNSWSSQGHQLNILM